MCATSTGRSPKLLPQVLDGLSKEYPDGIPASGADGLRFSLAALSGHGRDVKLSIPRVAGYRAFLNKIWNATRFAILSAGNEAPQPLEAVEADFTSADRWILSRLQAATKRVSEGVEDYRFDEAANGIYRFFWNELCDWYIELAKGSLQSGAEPARREATRSVLIHVLDASMRLLHPLCPFQSEEIWQKLPGREHRWGEDVRFCAVAPYPEVDEARIDEQAEREIGLLSDVVTQLRGLRRDSKIPLKQKVRAEIASAPEQHETFHTVEREICRLAGLSALSVVPHEGYEIPQQAAAHTEADYTVVLDLEGLIDLDAERIRIEKDLAKARKELEGYERKLGNEGYVNKAPAEVVAETRERADRCRERIEGLEASVARLSTPA